MHDTQKNKANEDSIFGGAGQRRYYLQVWNRPPGAGRNNDPTARLIFSRTYKSRAAAERMANHYRGKPECYVEVNPGYMVSW